jgi:hypothetical protein
MRLMEIFGKNIAGRAGCWWHTPVILAAQVAEIRRLTVQSQMVHETLSRKYLS